MPRVCTLYRYSVGKKIVMAATGLVLLGFVVGHLVGNLKIFLGRDAFNHYAIGLRLMGEPFLAPYQGVWLFRLVMLAALVAHVWSMWQLRQMSLAARPEPYQVQQNISFSWASSAMFWGGLTLAGYALLHLAHLTFGAVGPEFQTVEFRGHEYADAYANVIAGFKLKWLALLYIAAQVPLGLHLYHGLWSACQTLGLNHPKYNAYRRPVAAAVGVLIPLGFCSIPLAVLCGLVTN